MYREFWCEFLKRREWKVDERRQRQREREREESTWNV
jgi:hypothetical protein